jgi:hypothetical protein
MYCSRRAASVRGMKKALLAVVAALACPAAATASTATIGPALPLNAPSVNGVPCPSLGPDCWYTNVRLPPGGVVAATQSGTIVSWRAEGLAGSAEPVIVKQAAGPDMFSIVSEGPQVTEPCGGAPGLCNGGTTIHKFSVNMPIAPGEFFGIRLLSAANCISGGAGAGCTVIGGGTDGGVDGASGANTQPVGTPTVANNDPDATIGVNATEQLSNTGGNSPPGFDGVSLAGTLSEQLISSEGAEDAKAKIGCEAALSSDCLGSFALDVCHNPQKAADKSFNGVSCYIRQSNDFASTARAGSGSRLLTIGKANFKLAPGTDKTVSIPLSKAARKQLGKQHEFAALLVATAREGGKTKVTTRKIELKLKR